VIMVRSQGCGGHACQSGIAGGLPGAPGLALARAWLPGSVTIETPAFKNDRPGSTTDQAR
jgi:hypothetical protein